MVNTMRLPLGSQCVKYLMFIFNLLFVVFRRISKELCKVHIWILPDHGFVLAWFLSTITGIILLVIGIMIHGIYHNYEHFLDNKFLSVPSLLIAIGAIIFFIAFFGCCGAVRENYCMIITFTSLLVIVFILELAGGISGYVLRARASSIIQDKMKDSMKLYENNTDIQYIWNNLQTDFDCCGIKNASDWTTSLSKPDLPKSCCGKIETTCTLNSTTLHGGCYNKFVSFIKSHALQLGGFGIGIAFVQAIGIWFSIFLAKSIKNSYEVV